MQYYRFVLIILFLVVSINFAEKSTAKPMVVDTVENLKWFQITNLLGKLEEEYQGLSRLKLDVEQLSQRLQDLELLELYNPNYTGLNNEINAQFINNSIKKLKKSTTELNNNIFDQDQYLENDIGILKGVIYETPNLEIFELLGTQNYDRVKLLFGLKVKVDSEWKAINNLLDSLYIYSGLLLIVKDFNSQGFDEDFFNVLYSNIGLSSNRFLDRLNIYKKNIIDKGTIKEKKSIANAELFLYKKRIISKKYNVVKEDLVSFIYRFGNDIPLNTAYYFLGQVLQAMNNNLEAIKYYSEIDSSTKIFKKAIPSLIEACYQVRDFNKAEKYFAIIKNINKDVDGRIIFNMAQIYYELGKDKEIIELSDGLRKSDVFYLPFSYILGQSYFRREDTATASSIFTMISKSNSNDKLQNKFIDKSKIALAHIDLENGKYQLALNSYMKLLNTPNLFKISLTGISKCFVNMGDRFRSEIALKKLVNQFPEDIKGVEGLYDLSKNYLENSLEKVQQIKIIEKDIKRINEVQRQLMELAKEKVSDSTYQDASLLKLKQYKRTLSKDRKKVENEIVNLLGLSNKTISFLINEYTMGEFIEKQYIGQRRDIIKTISLLNASVVNRNKQSRSLIDKNEEKQRLLIRRAEILKKVSEAKSLKLRLLVNEKEIFDQFFNYNTFIIAEKIKEFRYKNQKSKIKKIEELRSIIIEEKKVRDNLNLTTRLKLLEQFKKEILSSKQDAAKLYYLSESYYEYEQSEFMKKDSLYEEYMTTYLLKLELFEKGERFYPPKTPSAPDFNNSVSKNFAIELLKKYPKSEFTDGALYSLMFIAFEEGEIEKARNYGSRLVNNYKESAYAPQTNLMLGETYFDEGQLKTAVKYYENTIKYPESKWFDKAMYKMAWTYYRLSDTKRAISVFYYLVLEQDKMAKNGLDMETVSKSTFINESIDYIAISFAESDTLDFEDLSQNALSTGLKKARKFIRRISNKYISRKILHKLGDVYMEQFKYEKAMQSYKLLKGMYPNYREMPSVMLSYVECLEQAGDFSKANLGRYSLFKRYNKNSVWASKMQDSVAVIYGDSIAEIALLHSSKYYHSLAIEQQNKNIYRKVIDMYWDYLKVYPKGAKSDECHYYIAEILFGNGEFLEATKEYMAVSREYPVSKYKEMAAMNAIVSAQTILELEEKRKKE